MHYTHFTIYPGDSKSPKLCRVDMDNETYFVTIEGKTIGFMERDYSVNFGFKTDNPEILTLMPDLVEKLSEVKARKDFGEMIKTVWPKHIISTEFLSDDKLFVLIQANTDIDVFGNEVQDIVLDYVEFEEHLDLMLQNEKSGKSFEVGIN